MVQHGAFDGHVCIATLDKPEGCLVETWGEDRVKKPSNDFLRDAITYHGYAEWTELSLLQVFRDINPTQGQGIIRPRFEFTLESGQVIGEVSLKHLDAYTVHASRTSVAFHRLKGSAHEGSIDSADERVSFHVGQVSICSEEEHFCALTPAMHRTPAKAVGEAECCLTLV